ncbi:MAG: hypothetical protein ABIQ16_07705 [Polyangiaceae bacterium]
MIAEQRETWLLRARRTKASTWLEVFIVSNLAFLGIDIFIAHQANAFARREEWLPIVFSVAAATLLTPALFSTGYCARSRGLSVVLGAGAVLLGVLGMLLHLRSVFFERQTLQALVYTAPFVAPLAYVGVGLLLLLNRLERRDSPYWARWVVLLAWGGFAGNFGLSLLDHAQNGFFLGTEWLSVVGAAFGTSFLLSVVLWPGDPRLRRVCAWLMLGEALLGVLGFAFHVYADVYTRPGATLHDRVIYGAPPFAPLLFSNLALLASLGLWSLANVGRALGSGGSGTKGRTPSLLE